MINYSKLEAVYLFCFSALSAGIAHINVGVNETPFDVHLELLCDYSPYFDSLYKDRSVKPVPESPVCFPDDDPDVFSELLGWMYRGTISSDLATRTKIPILLRLWVLAEKFGISGLQNDAIQLCKLAMDKSPGGIFGCDTIRYVYTRTLPESPLRLLVVDNWVQSGTKSRLSARQKELPRQFLEDLCCALIEGKDSKLDVERYYVVTPPAEDKQKEHLSRRSDDSKIVQPATPEQLRNRKIKHPVSRAHKNPLTREDDGLCPSRDESRSEEMSHLQIF